MNKIKELQTILGVTADGLFGPKSKAALEALISSANNDSATPLKSQQNDAGGAVDARSEKNIATLHPKLQPLARKLIQQAAANGMRFKITGGLRTYAEQDEIYAQGRTKPGEIVTYVRGGYSSHNFGTAFDVTEFRGSLPKYESPNYKKIGQIGKSDGLSWGGDWKRPVDEPHFYLKPAWAVHMPESEMMAELRQRHENRQDVFA